MRIPAIDEFMNHIPDARTEESMKEVLSCFYSGNLRSAVVMLYATVVSDIYYKLSELVAVYSDAGATQIKEYVEKEWHDHPKSPAWETEMPRKCREKNKILGNDSYAHFSHLQDERNLCAHPVITEGELYRPSFATVQGFITDMLKGILCKPSFLSKNLVDVFTSDIEEASQLFLEDSKLRKYINAKYLEKIDNEREEYDLFKKLWKFTFKNTDSRSTKNRKANLSILGLLLERHQQFMEMEIKKDEAYYSTAVNMNDSSCIKAFVCFMNDYKSVYSSMSEDFRMQLEQKINARTNLSAIAFFLSANPLVHAKTVSSGISVRNALYMYVYLKKNVGESDAIDFSIRLYGDSGCYDDADDYFDNLVEPILDYMSEAQLVKLIEYSDSNSQIYGRRNFGKSKSHIKACMDDKNPQYDYSRYIHF